jgi:hypothetical protein
LLERIFGVKNAKGRPELWCRPFHDDSTALKKTVRNREKIKRRTGFANGELVGSYSQNDFHFR